MPRILLLADAASEHTQKWAIGLSKKGLEVGVFSFNKTQYNWWEEYSNIYVLYQPDKKSDSNSTFTKITYLKYLRKLKKIISKFNPDVLHAHYATSYGLLGRLTGFHPFIISAWGTDVMKFPQQNIINKTILRTNFKKTDVICATSVTIKNYINQIIDKSVEVVPFGVDCSIFKSDPSLRKYPKDTVVIGCIKSLEHTYRIDVLIQAFKIVSTNNKNLKLLIVGGGSLDAQLKELCINLQIDKQVEFTGKVPHSDIVKHFNSLDIFCNLSNYESFGVSVIEAMACEVPVIATNTGGLKEIINSEKVGVLVPVGDVEKTAIEIQKLINSKELRSNISKNARQHVLDNYSWDINLNQMISIYNSVL